MAQEDVFKKLVAHCKEYGFVFPSSDIYDGLGAVYDYGQNGVELKNNIKRYWWESMVRLHENIVGIDSAIFMHPTIWKASGHVDAFNDPLIDNKDSKKRYRADVRMSNALNANDLNEVRQIILDEKIVCPISGTCNWTEVRQFNLMFATEMGSTAEGASKIYLRPETAQGIFVNFLNVQKTGRMKVPFGIAQIGKAFRNEIVARQFIFRMREFEQMEILCALCDRNLYRCRPDVPADYVGCLLRRRPEQRRQTGFPCRTAPAGSSGPGKDGHYATGEERRAA